MAKPLVSDELWQRIEPLLPQPKPRRFRFPGQALGLPQGPHRHHLRPQDGHLLGGVAPGDGLWLWHDLPELPQCLAAAGVWEKLHQILLAELEQADKLDWSRAAVIVPRPEPWGAAIDRPQSDGSRQTREPSTDVLTEGQGVPLVTHSTGANVPDVNELLPLVDDIPPVRRKADRPRGVPDNLYADRAYDSQPHRQELEARGIDPTWRGVGPNTAVAWGSIAGWRSGPCRGCTAFAGSGCGPIERVRVHDAFVSLASALICMWFL